MNLGQAWNPELQRIDPERVEQPQVAPAGHVWQPTTKRTHEHRSGAPRGIKAEGYWSPRAGESL